MTNIKSKLRKVATIVACLTVTTMFAACGNGNDDENGNGNGNGSGSPTSDVGVVINGVKWATRNVDKPGTFAAKPETPGMFYQWNRKVGYAATGNVTNWDANVPTGVSWPQDNDPSPSGWRIPSLAQLQTLLDTEKVSRQWTTQNKVNGMKFTDKATGNSIFLPAAGLRNFDTGELLNAGEYGRYWSRERPTTGIYSNTNALYMWFINDNSPGWGDNLRRYGFSVRSVALAE